MSFAGALTYNTNYCKRISKQSHIHHEPSKTPLDTPRTISNTSNYYQNECGISFAGALDNPDVAELHRKAANTDEASRRGVELHHLQTRGVAIVLEIEKPLST